MNRRYYGIENVCSTAAGVYDLQTIINNIIPPVVVVVFYTIHTYKTMYKKIVYAFAFVRIHSVVTGRQRLRNSIFVRKVQQKPIRTPKNDDKRPLD